MKGDEIKKWEEGGGASEGANWGRRAGKTYAPPTCTAPSRRPEIRSWEERAEPSALSPGVPTTDALLATSA